jgi:hypothetical protein
MDIFFFSSLWNFIYSPPPSPKPPKPPKVLIIMRESAFLAFSETPPKPLSGSPKPPRSCPACGRVKQACEQEYLINEEERARMPANIVLGDPLPDEQAILPKPQDIDWRDEEPLAA